MSGSSNLIVRVKRRRDAVPTDTLCIVEDDPESGPRKKASLAGLSMNEGQDSVEQQQISKEGEGADMVSSDLNTDKETKAVRQARRKLVLRRINTVNGHQRSNDRALIASSIAEAEKNHIEKIPASQQIQEGEGEMMVANSDIWITQSKKYVRTKGTQDSSSKLSRGSDSFLLVDVSQVSVNTQSRKRNSTQFGESNASEALLSRKNSSNTRAPNESKNKVTVLNPATRKLQNALDNIFTGKKLDLNDVMTSILQGADINHQRTVKLDTAITANNNVTNSGGETALMAAVFLGNIRMVERLLARGSQVLLPDVRGNTALDYVTMLMNRNTRIRISAASHDQLVLLLNKAAAKNAADRDRLSALANPTLHPISTGVQFTSDQTAVSGGMGADANMDAEDDYVYDIFSIDAAQQSAVQQATDSEIFDNVNNAAGSEGDLKDAAHPLVYVSGLIISNDGFVDIDTHFSYDSDWSDLGEDEDPDSNDERYDGNDYPEEQDDEDDQVLQYDSNQDSDHLHGRRHSDSSDYDSDDGEDNMQRMAMPVTSHNYNDMDNDSDGDDEYCFPQSNSSFHNGTGSVMRPHLAEFEDSIDTGVFQPEECKDYSTEDLQKAAQQDLKYDSVYRQQHPGMRVMAYRDKVRALRHKHQTKMMNKGYSGGFLYGTELSDDEADEEHLISAMYKDSNPHQALADTIAMTGSTVNDGNFHDGSNTGNATTVFKTPYQCGVIERDGQNDKNISPDDVMGHDEMDET